MLEQSDEQKLIDFIKSVGNLPKHLRAVHDFAVHHSNIDIDKQIKNSLYYVAETERHVSKI